MGKRKEKEEVKTLEAAVVADMTVEGWLDTIDSEVESEAGQDISKLAVAARKLSKGYIEDLNAADQENRLEALRILIRRYQKEENSRVYTPKPTVTAEELPAKKAAAKKSAEKKSAAKKTTKTADKAVKSAKAPEKKEKKSAEKQPAAKKAPAKKTATKKAKEETDPRSGATLTREGILGFLNRMHNDSVGCPVETSVSLKKEAHMPDGLYCGDWCFGLVYENKEQIKLVLRLSPARAAALQAQHSGASAAPLPGDWTSITAEGAFPSKKEAYSLLKEAYRNVLKKSYNKKDGRYTTNAAAAIKDSESIERAVISGASEAGPDAGQSYRPHKNLRGGQ